jgi:hypothetical protein
MHLPANYNIFNLIFKVKILTWRLDILNEVVCASSQPLHTDATTVFLNAFLPHLLQFIIHHYTMYVVSPNKNLVDMWQNSIFFKTETILLTNSALHSISNHDFRVLLFEYFSNRVVGTCQTCYSYHWPSPLTALHVPALPRTLRTEFLSDDHNNMELHQW